MVKDNTVLIVVIIVSLAVVGAAFMIGYDNDNHCKNTDTGTEYWHQVAYFGYVDGEYIDSTVDDPYGMYEYDIAIYEKKNGTFTGSYNESNIVGLTYDDIVYFYGTYSGEKIMFRGVIDGDTMYGITTNQTEDSNRALYTVYSLDPDGGYDSDPIPEFNLDGTWIAGNAKALDLDKITTLEDETIDVTSQNGPTFSGTMRQNVDGTEVELPILGVISNEIVGDYNLAYVLDENGENWSALVSNDAMMLQTLFLIEGEDSDHISSVEKTYTRDGSEVKFFEPTPLAGTDWVESYAFNALQWNSFNETFNLSSLHFEIQNGNLLSGTMMLNEIICPMAAYMIGETSMYIATYYKSHVILLLADFDDGEIKTYETFTSLTMGGRVSQVTTYLSEIVQPEDITDHWYVLSGRGFVNIDSDPINAYNYSRMTKEDQTSILYDFDILDVKDDEFIICFMGQTSTGTINEEGTLELSVTVDGKTLRAFGEFCNDHVLYFHMLIESDEEDVCWVAMASTDPTIIAYVPITLSQK